MAKAKKPHPETTQPCTYKISRTRIWNGYVYLKVEENNGLRDGYKWIRYAECSNFSDDEEFKKSW